MIGIVMYYLFQAQAAMQDFNHLYEESVPAFLVPESPCVKTTICHTRIPNRGFYPIHSRSKEMGIFQHMVELELRQISSVSSEHKCNNLTREESIALKLLQKNSYITIHAADKDGSTVVLDRDLYEKYALEMLSDEQTYRTLTCEPTREISVALDRIVCEGVSLGVLDDKLRDHMLVKFPVCPVFQALPKVHKGLFPPPLRPIIAGIGSLLEHTCQWLDNLSQPPVHRVPGYIKDTKELLRAFHDMEWHPQDIWVTCNISSLYTCIPHDKAISALLFHLQKYGNYCPH